MKANRTSTAGLESVSAQWTPNDLEEFSVEVLEAVLLMLRGRQLERKQNA